ncbi:MAG: helix-turn-helix domain-containing protein [Ruminococcus sp.]|nr:helix-turn-helix domain-containing protein [Ruminococcus sp.]
MTRFSEYLEQIIIRSGMTEKELAKMSGFTRSYIALMKNGQRVSPDEDKMIRLMQGLNLSPDEEKKFKEEYIRARIGDEVYERDTAVMDFVDNFNNISNISISSSWQYNLNEIRTIDSRMDLEQVLHAVIRKESMKKDGFIHIIMQGADNPLRKILPEVCGNNHNLKIDHIVCIENGTENGAKNPQLYNVNLLKELVPTAVFSSSVNYQVYYYYDHVSSRFNTGTLLSYMVLTSEYLVCMNSEMSLGMVTRDKESRDLYEQLFQNQKKRCRQMFLYMTNVMDMLSSQVEEGRKEDISWSLSQQPCFGVLKVESFIRKYFQDKSSHMVPAFVEMIRKNRQSVMQDNKKHVSYCSKEGLRRFIQEGVVDEIPKEFYTELSRKDRKIILTLLLQAIDEGYYEMYFVDDLLSKIPKELFINVYGMLDVVVLYLSDKKEARFLLNENSMTRIIYEAFKNLPKNPQIISKEDTRTYLESLIRQI